MSKDWPGQEISLGSVLTAQDEKFVPGQFYCAKCDFGLVSRTLYVKSRTIGANDEPQQCPNGCGPLWRETWKRRAENLMDFIDQRFSAEREAAVDMMVKTLERLEKDEGHKSKNDSVSVTMKCTWAGCENEAKHPQIAKLDGIMWANLCDRHNNEIDSAIDFENPKELVRGWIKAQGGAKKATERMMKKK